MEISNVKYCKDNGKNISISCTLNGKNTAIPLDPDNTEYQAIQEWVADGNKVEEAD